MRSVALFSLLALAACSASQPAFDEDAPRRRSTSNVVYGEDLITSGDFDIERSLANRVPGVDLRVYSGRSMLIIRGINTILGDPRPLYVLDGMVLSREAGSPLRMLNVYDIDYIEVLKSAGDTALYGVLGGNGVIRIYTRRPPPPPVDDGKEEGDA